MDNEEVPSPHAGRNRTTIAAKVLRARILRSVARVPLAMPVPGCAPRARTALAEPLALNRKTLTKH
jgi:hypothetical protein